MSSQQVPLFLGLIAAGLAGNYFNFPLFLSIDFLFGSIFTMLALQCFGLWRGVLAAALIAGCTYILWNHPYAIVILTAEVAVVGWLMKRHRMGMLLADALYWLVIGMPLVFVFYHLVMHVSQSTANIVMVKQAVNGVANALLARILFGSIAGWTQFRPISLQETVGNLLTAFLLFPVLILLALNSRNDFAETDQNIRAALQQKSLTVTSSLADWVQDRTQTVLSLTALAATHTAQQMQDRLEQARAADSSFLRIGMRDTESVITAYSPPIDESGQSNIGKKFPERPYIPTLKEKLQPMLAEVVMGRIDKAEPAVILLAPILREGQYAGYINSVLRLSKIRKSLERYAESDTLFYTLMDNKGQVILSNRKDQKIMTPFVRSEGTLGQIDTKISQWVPKLPHNVSVSELWTNSYYVAQSTVGDLGGWQLLLEQPVAPFQRKLYTGYTDQLALLFIVLFLALGLAEILSRRTTATLRTLSAITQDLPLRLTEDTGRIAWPDSSVQETRHLIKNFRVMADSLRLRFKEVRQINESLDLRVKERTLELSESEAHMSAIFQSSPIGIVVSRLSDEVTLDVNDAALQLFRFSRTDVVGRRAVADLATYDDPAQRVEMVARLRDNGSIHSYPVRYRTHNGKSIVLEVSGSLIETHGEPCLLALLVDVTDRNRSEEIVRQLAYYDPLTNLANRLLLADRLTQSMLAGKRNGQYGALLFVDLDNFKPVNDEHGHGAGDLLLVEAARRIKSCVREIDTVARYGGDEFIVLVNDLTTDNAHAQSQATLVAEKIRSLLASPYILQLPVDENHPARSIEHRCTACIGVTLFLGFESTEQEILRRADIAMYNAKMAGRNLVWSHDSNAGVTVQGLTKETTE